MGTHIKLKRPVSSVPCCCCLFFFFFCRLSLWPASVLCAINPMVWANVTAINERGPYLGLVAPNTFEMYPILQLGILALDTSYPTIDASGRRFYIGDIEGQRVIMVMTGEAMLNAGITTQLLLTYFDVSGVLHFGIAGNANDELNIGDITIPQYWAHTGLWYWQRYGEGADDELAFEENGDYTRDIGYLGIGNYNDPPGNRTNFLNNIWYQEEEVFSVRGTPEVRQRYFWVPADKSYYTIATRIVDEGLDLQYCTNETTCLSTQPKVVTVARGVSSNFFLDNAAYRSFLHETFDVSPVDMETAAVALTCLTNNVSFIAFRALSDLAGGGPDESNEATIFSSLAAINGIIVLRQFLSLLSSSSSSSMTTVSSTIKQSIL